MAVRRGVPSYEDLLADLQMVREAGVGRLRSVAVPALAAAARLRDLSDDESSDVPGVQLLLREAVSRLGDGGQQEAAEYSLGLYPGTQLWKNVQRRERAAEAYGVSAATYRKRWEAETLGLVAEVVLLIAQEARLRQARLDIEERRHPADSRLAVQWVERFEAYNKMWTPAWALAADLEAAIDTYREGPSERAPWDPDGPAGYNYEAQAERYGRDALYRLTHFMLELKRFMLRHGGMWLFSSAETEEEVSDAVYRIGWHNPIPAEGDSFLRGLLADTRHEELLDFHRALIDTPLGQEIEAKWQRMIREAVSCETEEQKRGSQAWLTIAACREYCDKVDADWLKIADWYRPGSMPHREPQLPLRLYRDIVDRSTLARDSGIAEVGGP